MSIVKDSMYGFVIGDAMGVPIEFQSREKLKKNPVKDMIAGGSYFYLSEGIWSDDSALTLATMDSISKCNGNIDYKDMIDRFCSWMNHAEYTTTKEVFDIGITTKYSLLRYLEESVEPTKCGGNKTSDNGNGSLMRMLPIAIYCYYKKLNDNEILEIVKNTSSLTHAHEQSIMGCFIYVKYLLYILLGNDKYTSYNKIKEIDYRMFKDETIDVYKRVLTSDISKEPLDNIISSGYVVHTLETVLWNILNNNNFNDTIISAINLGEDTDTIGAITGSIAGILYGYDNINKDWINKLKNKELLDSIISNFEKSFL